jgi:hypothetical protein
MNSDEKKTGVIHGRLTHDAGGPVRHAEVRLHQGKVKSETATGGRPGSQPRWTVTDDEGRFRFEDVEPASYVVESSPFGQPARSTVTLSEECLGPNEILLVAELRIQVICLATDDAGAAKVAHVQLQRTCILRLESAIARKRIREFVILAEQSGATIQPPVETDARFRAFRPGTHWLKVFITDSAAGEFSTTYAEAMLRFSIDVAEPEVAFVSGDMGVQLQRTRVDHTLDQALWSAIRLHTRRIGFGPYQDFINRVLCGKDIELAAGCNPERISDTNRPLHGVGAYEVLRCATEAFLLRNCGILLCRESDLPFFHREAESVRMQEPVTFEFVQHRLREYLGSPHQLPYITRVIADAFPWYENQDRDGDSLLTCRRLNQPCMIELIWSYWHEEGMLVQTMNAIARRFQNVRGHHRDPLANLEIDPLRPLNNILWGFIQDEFRRLTVKRRAYEYGHHYGLGLYGKAVSHMNPADNRSKFIEAFHNLLHLCAVFFKEDNDTTVIADGYPLLHALKEVHLLLAQGAQNQFGDLPWTARAEMLLHQWMLARPEIRDFLQSRAMVPYMEAWMPQVDTMKTLQSWSDVTVTHFRDLGVYGEQILLSVRYADWIAVNDEDSAKNWARYWRPEIQGYLHAYRAATGVDLSHGDLVDSTLPSVLLQGRLASQQQPRFR